MATEIDPICQMDVDIDNPPGGQSDYEGTTYYFCAPGCKVAFDKEPEKYMSEAHDHEDHEGHDDGAHEEPAAEEGHDDHGHDHGPGGHSHGHHMPDAPAQTAPTANKPGFFARLFGRK